jgi:hypothetical protein
MIPKVVFPPVEDVPEELFFTRLPYGTKITVYFPNRESYDLDVDSLDRYLRMIGFSTPMKLVATVWQFYGLWLNTKTGEFDTVPRAQIEEVMSDGEKRFFPFLALFG